MSYYLSRILTVSFDEAVIRAIEALKKEGFGILTEIDVSATLKKKINVDFPNYRIVVRDAGNGQIEVAAIDPVASMQAIENSALKQAAAQVRAKLKM